MPPVSELTYKQRLFVDAYLGAARGNATESARIAGYTGTRNSLRTKASGLLKHPLISAAIDAGVSLSGVAQTRAEYVQLLRTHIAKPRRKRRTSAGPWWVYVLEDPRDGAIRYVGVTTDPERRIRDHVQSARLGDSRTLRHRWLLSLRDDGLEPELVLLERTLDWDEAERRWIKALRAAGCDLTNGNDGGVTLWQAHEAIRLRGRRNTVTHSAAAEAPNPTIAPTVREPKGTTDRAIWFVIDVLTNPDKKWTSATVADRLRVSQRTAFRYIARLREFGILRSGERVNPNQHLKEAA